MLYFKISGTKWAYICVVVVTVCQEERFGPTLPHSETKKHVPGEWKSE